MDEEMLKQILAEMTVCIGESMAMLTAGVAKQLDATQLAEHLKEQVIVKKNTEELSQLTWRLVNTSIAAAEAESSLQKEEASNS